MAGKVSDRVQQQLRTAFLETAKHIIDSEKRAYQGVRNDYAAMLTKYKDATEQELIRWTWLRYIKRAMCIINDIYDNQKTYSKSDSERFCQASSSSKTSLKCKKKRERIDLGNVETGTKKRKCVEKASMSEEAAKDNIAESVETNGVVTGVEKTSMSEEATYNIANSVKTNDGETASMSKEAMYNIAKSVKTNGCVSTDDDRNRSECGDSGEYGSIEGDNSIPGCKRPQQMSHRFRTSTPKSSATSRQREDIVAKQQEHIGRAQSDQSSERDLCRIATNDNTIYENYPVVNVVNTDASATATAAMTVATNLSSSAVRLSLSPKPSSRVNDDNRSRNSRTTKVSFRTYAMRADVRWYVKSSFADYRFAPDDRYAFVNGNGTVATIRYDSAKKSLNVVDESRQIAFSKTVSQRIAAKKFDAFEMLAYLKMDKVVGRRIVILAYDVDERTYIHIMGLLQQNGSHLVSGMNDCRGLQRKDIQAAIGRGGVIFRRANTRSFVGFQKAYNRILGVSGIESAADGKMIAQLCTREAQNRIVECGTAVVNPPFAYLSVFNESTVGENHHDGETLSFAAAANVHFSDVVDGHVKDAVIVRNNRGSTFLLSAQACIIHKLYDLCL